MTFLDDEYSSVKRIVLFQCQWIHTILVPMDSHYFNANGLHYVKLYGNAHHGACVRLLLLNIEDFALSKICRYPKWCIRIIVAELKRLERNFCGDSWVDRQFHLHWEAWW